nr:10330_t:CDS:10 [Entrophospora candida]
MINSPTFTAHKREPSVPHEVKETLDATVTETQDGERCLNNYILREVIGRGAYGTVIQAIEKDTNAHYAIKEFSKARLRKRDMANYFRRGGFRGARRGRFAPNPNLQDNSDPLYLIRGEVAVLKKLNHPNVVKLFEVLDDPENDSLYMVFEMCDNGNLMNISINKQAKPFSEEKSRLYFIEMILDIKPDNLLLSKDDILKIVDFGVSEIFVRGNDKTTKSAGSPAFMAPELCKAHHGEISGKAADIWSMGVTLYCLVFGRLPFEKDNILELYESIKNHDIQISGNINPDLADILYKLLEKDPDKRITMHELREHPWVTLRGAEPLISTAENCTEMVTEITDDELSSAIKPISIRSLVTLITAVKKFKRLSRTQNHYPEALIRINDDKEAVAAE